MAQAVIVLESVQEVRDLQEKVRRQLAVIVPATSRLYTYEPNSRQADDGVDWLKPTVTDCECCKGRGRWMGSELGSNTIELVVEGGRAIRQTGLDEATDFEVDEEGVDVVFTTEKSNDNGVVDLIGAPTVLTAKNNGQYQISGRVVWKEGTNGTYHKLELVIDGTGEVLDVDIPNDMVSNAVSRTCSVAANVRLLEGQQVKLKAYTDATDDGRFITWASLQMALQSGGGIASSASGNPTGPAGGDLDGTYPSPTVKGLQGKALPSPIPDGFLKRTALGTAWEEVAYSRIRQALARGGDAPLEIDQAAEPTDNTNNDAIPGRHGLVPKPPNDAARALNGKAQWILLPDPDLNEWIINLAGGPVGVGGVATIVTPGAGSIVVVNGKTYQDYATNGLINNNVGLGHGGSKFIPLETLFDHDVHLVTGPDVSDIRIWSVLADLGGGGFPSSDYIVSSGIGFRYSTAAGDANWMAVTNDGDPTGTVVDTGVPVTADTEYRLRILMEGGHAYFFIDDVQVADITTHLPGSVSATVWQDYIALAAAVKHVLLGRIRVRWK